LLRNGDLIAFVNYERLIRLDWNSNIVWRSENLGFHHDISEAANGDIYALARKLEYIPELSLTHLTANDYITILGETGDVRQKLSIAKLLLDADIPIIRVDIEIDYPRITSLTRLIIRVEERTGSALLVRILKKIDEYYEKLTRPKDFFHTNTIEIVAGQKAGYGRDLLGANTILICIRNQNLVAIVDIDREKIVWSWGTKELEHPHDPAILANGDLLIFDNGYRRKYSRIIELDPATLEIEWEYRSTPPEKFFSETRGSNQELANGNILIADSRNGRAFEITRGGETVWEYYNPMIKTESDENQRATIFRMRRLTDTENLPLPREFN